MPKQVMFSDEGRAALLRGVNIMAAAVKATLGPKGRNVVIDKKFGSPTITKDGVTVAKEIELKDNYEDMGAQMVKEVASKTSDIAGDGTTTATVLAHAIVREGLKNVTASPSPRRSSSKDPFENMGAQMVKEVASKTSDVAGDGTTTATVLAQAIFREGLRNVTAGANPMGLKRGIDKAVEAVVEELKKLSEVDQGQEGDRPGRHHRRQQRQDDRQPDRRGDGEGRQGRRHHRRGVEDGRDRAGRGRGHAVRPRLPLARTS